MAAFQHQGYYLMLYAVVLGHCAELADRILGIIDHYLTERRTEPASDIARLRNQGLEPAP